MEEHSHLPRRHFPSKDEVVRALGTFSPLERLGFLVLTLIAFIAVLTLLYGINKHFLVSVPTEGGTLKEGVVGTPRFVNPVLATTDADRELTSLVYRGLMHKDEYGNIVPDLAETYSVSDDGLTYTFTLKNAYFHDGEIITADDVAFTIAAALDATLKSSHRVEWEGVTVRVIDEKTVTFNLNAAYAPFLESTTLGIMPKHVWEQISYENWIYSDFNTERAIGSGLYEVNKITENSSGIPETYRLSAFRENEDVTPLIDTIIVHFYANEEDLIRGYQRREVDAISGVDPVSARELADNGAHVMAVPLPRVFGLFFNQTQAPIFAESAVRKAVRAAINKERVVTEVLKGYGTAISGPIPDAPTLTNPGTDSTTETDYVAEAKTILEKAGWVLGEDGIYAKNVTKSEYIRLSFEIATSDVPELTEAVDVIIEDLRAAGIEATAKVYESGSLSQNVIRPRKFQALFFGEAVSSQSDLYAFWHSSQRTDPGLNISNYANTRTDSYLQDALGTLDATKRDALYASFEKELDADAPAAFVYAPTFLYIVRPGTPGISLGKITRPEDRFSTIRSWYLDTERIWKVFVKD